jgi:glycosyltransferase involved in cell wall biosynthesis
MGAAGRELAQDRYSWDAIAARLLEIYESVSGREPARAAAPR